MEYQGDGGEDGRLERWLGVVVGLVAADKLSLVLQRAVEGACRLTEAVAGTLDSPSAGGATFSVGEPSSRAVAEVAPGDELLVPVMVAGAPFATVHLTGTITGSPFTPADRSLVVGLAALAGTVIERLTLQREHRRDRWVALLNEIASALLAGSHSDDVLALSAEGARELAEADLAVVCIGDQASRFIEVRAADGVGAEKVMGLRLEDRGTAVAELMADGEPVNLDTSSGRGGRGEPLLGAGVSGPALFVPLSMEGRPIGALAVGRLEGRPSFTDDECWLVESFASQVSVNLEFGVAHVELKRVAVAADQERIARDLHDTVVQQLYAIGMSLQALAKSTRDPDAVGLIDQAVDGLDLTIRDIQATVFALQHPPLEGEGLRSEVRLLAEDLSRVYGLTPMIRFHGLLDIAVPEPVAVNVLATVREALSNVGRHARATTVEIDVEIATAVVVRVADDGIGIPERTGRRSGLRNLEDRATSLGGTMRLSRAARGGTVLLWRVPLANGLDRRQGAEVTGRLDARIAVTDHRPRATLAELFD